MGLYRAICLLFVTVMLSQLLISGEAAGVKGTLYKGKTYYVSPSGKDGASGGQKDPWRSIQHAANSVSPGDRVFIHGGTYPEHVSFRISGKQHTPILFSAAPGEKVTVKGLELAKGIAYLNITNLSVEGFKYWGVSLEGNNHHVKLSGLIVKGGEAGVHFTTGDSGSSPEQGPVSNVTVENTLVQNPQYTAIDCTPGPCDKMIFRYLEVTGAGGTGENSWGADGLAIERGRHILVENCYIHDNSGDGIDLNSRDTAGNISGIVVRRNRVVRNHRNGIKLWAGGRMEHNIIWGHGDTAVVLGDWPGKYEVVNNTIAFNMWDSKYSDRNYALVAAYPNDETGISANIQITLRNTIFAFNSSDAVGGPTGIYLGKGVRLISEGNNLYWSQDDNEIIAEFIAAEREFTRAQIADGTWASATGQGVGNITADPLFVAGWPKVDVRLRSGSPAIAINAGALPDVLSAGTAASKSVASPSSGKGTSSAPSGPVPSAPAKTVPMATETGKVIQPQQAGSANLNGLWESSSGPIYNITQSGNRIKWTVQGSDEKGNGIISNNQNISANWSSKRGSGSWNGQITKTDSQGKAVRIDWNNGVFFAR